VFVAGFELIREIAFRILLHPSRNVSLMFSILALIHNVHFNMFIPIAVDTAYNPLFHPNRAMPPI